MENFILLRLVVEKLITFKLNSRLRKHLIAIDWLSHLYVQQKK